MAHCITCRCFFSQAVGGSFPISPERNTSIIDGWLRRWFCWMQRRGGVQTLIPWTRPSSFTKQMWLTMLLSGLDLQNPVLKATYALYCSLSNKSLTDRVVKILSNIYQFGQNRSESRSALHFVYDQELLVLFESIKITSATFFLHCGLESCRCDRDDRVQPSHLSPLGWIVGIEYRSRCSRNDISVLVEVDK